MHVFVDESARRSYLLGAVVLVGATDPVRAALRGLCRPGQRRIHFVQEDDSRRRTILSTLGMLGLTVRIYRCRPVVAEARAMCLRALLDEILPAGATRLVLESRDSLDRADDEVIRTVLRERGTGRLAFRHALPHEEPLLWVPDAVLWAVGRGGDRRRRAEPLVEKVVDVEPG